MCKDPADGVGRWQIEGTEAGSVPRRRVRKKAGKSILADIFGVQNNGDNKQWDFRVHFIIVYRFHRKFTPYALAGVAQWIEHQTTKQRVTVRFPVRARARVAGQVPWCGKRDRQPHTDVSLPLLLPLFPSV